MIVSKHQSAHQIKSETFDGIKSFSPTKVDEQGSDEHDGPAGVTLPGSKAEEGVRDVSTPTGPLYISGEQVGCEEPDVFQYRESVDNLSEGPGAASAQGKVSSPVIDDSNQDSTQSMRSITPRYKNKHLIRLNR